MYVTKYIFQFQIQEFEIVSQSYVDFKKFSENEKIILATNTRHPFSHPVLFVDEIKRSIRIGFSTEANRTYFVMNWVRDSKNTEFLPQGSVKTVGQSRVLHGF